MIIKQLINVKTCVAGNISGLPVMANNAIAPTNGISTISSCDSLNRLGITNEMPKAMYPPTIT